MGRADSASSRLFERSQRVVPGGVNSPVRAWSAVGGEPLYMARAAGSRVFDEDGRGYLDYVCAWGPLILGHTPPSVVEAVVRAASAGTGFGAPTRGELELAELVSARMKGIEQLRLVNSGTEAAMSALRVARGYTGRTKVLKFDGCYHGHVDALLAKAGSGVANLSLPDSAGVPESFTGETLVAEFNDAGSAQRLVRENREDLAAVIVEPVCGNMGVIPPEPGFLESLRELASGCGAVLIFDEVITGFGRLGSPFAAAHFDLLPDIVTLAKGLTNGTVPMGAVAVRDELFDAFMAGPEGAIELTHGYTYSGHPLACAAARATLDVYRQDGLLTRAAELSEHWENAAHGLRGLPHVIDIRNIGLTAAIELAPVPGKPAVRGMTALHRAFRKGAFIRVTGDTVALAPPLPITPAQIDELFGLVAETIEEVADL